MSLSVPVRLGVVTDEIDIDLRRAASVARELDLSHVELNQVGARNVTQLSAADARQALTILRDHGLQVSVIGTPCFKAVLLDEARAHGVRRFGPLVEHLELLKRGLEQAHRFECEFVRIFSFRKTGMVNLGNPTPRLPGGGQIPLDELHKIVEALRLAGDVAQSEKVGLIIENVRSCWGNSGENVARICAAVGHPRVKVLWDPGNAHVSGGVAFPDGYYAVRDVMVHVHVKDARVVEAATGRTSWEAMGAGEVDYVGQLRALISDGYSGLVSLETHWRGEGLNREQSTRASLRGLLELLEQVTSAGSL